ncbi:hypothetical protein V8E36_000391 [Tilletia maclaganii]
MPLRKKRRGAFDSCDAEFLECDGEADRPYTRHVAADLPSPRSDTEDNADAMDIHSINALIRAAHGPSAPIFNADLAPVARHEFTFGPQHDEQPFFDFDYDDGARAYEDQLRWNDINSDPESDIDSASDVSDPLMPIGMDPPDDGGSRHRRITRRRFDACTARIPSIFTCLHGGADPPPSTPILPDTRGVTSCDCDPDQRSVLLNLDVYDIVAFTIRFIRLYQSLFNVTGISATNMALVVQQLMRYGLTFSRQMETHMVSSTLRRQLQPALAWLTVVDRYCDKVALEGPILVDKARPPSTSPGSQFVEAPQVIVCVDGTFTQKRRHGRHGAGRQPFPPRRFLSLAQVEEVAVLMGRAEGTAPDDTLCAARVRAADAEDARGGSPFEIRGVMGLCCRHDIPLLLCDIDSPGERHYYTVALIRALAQAVGPNLKHLGVAYDIGCRFQPSEKVANVLGPVLKITWTVPVFHVYGHMYSCQVHFSPRNTRGFGMTDGEGMERIWSAMESLIKKNTRNMSAGERCFALEERVRFIATERRINLIDILDVKAQRLNDIIELARTIMVEKFDASDLPSWYREYEEQHQEDESGDLFQDRSIIIHLRPAYQASKCFEGIDPGVLTAVGLLSHRRRLQLDHQQARDSTSSPPTGSKSPSTSPSSSSVYGDPADSDDDEHPAAAQSSISPVGICACALLREISEVQLLSAMLVIRPAKVRKGYATTVKFRQGISAAKLRAGKAMNKLNEALLERHRLHGGELPI